MIQSPALERLVRSSHPARGAPAPGRPTDGERCELCGVAVEAGHHHLVDLENGGAVVCACTACSLLFERPGAAGGRYRLVPRRRRRLGPDHLPAEIPVGLAFFTRHGDAVIANYPSPLGATRWELDVEWDAFEAAHPVVATMEPDTEAVLVNTARGANECWLVPIDDCYRLVGIIRREWRGMSGGSGVWVAVEEFFAGLGPPGAGSLRPPAPTGTTKEADR